MEMLLVAGIAFVVSLLSGILGLGGAVLLIPAYLYVPAMVGLTPLDMKHISGMTSIQVLATSLVGMVMHGKKGAVNKSIVINIGLPIAIFSFAGAYLSGFVSSDVLVFVFAVMAVLGAAMLVLRKENESTGKHLQYNKPGAWLVGGGVGIFGGMVGAPGAFLLSPLMMTVLRIPTRMTIGSTLGIVLLSAGAASVGKIASDLVPVSYTIAAVAGSIPGVIIGSLMSHRFQTRTLRIALALFIGLVGVQMWYQILMYQ